MNCNLLYCDLLVDYREQASVSLGLVWSGRGLVNV
jgi:hypothetical protein